MERKTADRVEAAYKVLHPNRPSTRGFAQWFRRELSNRGEVDVTATTIHKWLTNGIPVDRLVVVDQVVRSLEADARDALQRMEATLGP